MRLLCCLLILSNIEALAKLRSRRDDRRVVQEINDIFPIINAFNELDEKQRLSQLPNFVSDSGDKKPSNSKHAGDVKAIMKNELFLGILHNSLCVIEIRLSIRPSVCLSRA
jgi:Asp-tRNA(Asn)/Glu-tRNA(Gln) amidotransferase C subunit